MRSMTLLAYKSMEGSLEEVRFLLFTFTSVLGPLRAVFGDPWKCCVRNSSGDSALPLAVFFSLC